MGTIHIPHSDLRKMSLFRLIPYPGCRFIARIDDSRISWISFI